MHVLRSKHYSALTDQIYRFQPVAFSLKSGDLKMIHGNHACCEAYMAGTLDI